MATVSDADVRTAQVAVDTWVDAMTGREDGSWVTSAAALELRGILAATMADVREAGYFEGADAARQEAATSAPGDGL